LRQSRLDEANDLQKFLSDLDHFQQWLSRTQTDIAFEHNPDNAAVDADALLIRHQLVKEEMNQYAPDYAKMKDFGAKVVNERDGGVDYVFLREV